MILNLLHPLLILGFQGEQFSCPAALDVCQAGVGLLQIGFGETGVKPGCDRLGFNGGAVVDNLCLIRLAQMSKMLPVAA